MADSTPTTKEELIDAIEAVAAVQDPEPWAPNFYWPPIPASQPQLIAAYIDPSQETVDFIFDTPLSDDEPDDANFTVALQDDAENRITQTVTEVTLVGDYTVQVAIEGGASEPGTAFAAYNNTTPPLVESAEGKEANPGSVVPTQEI